MYLLEDAIECWVVNARDVKNVPGRPKTGRLDAVWLAKLAGRGMLDALIAGQRGRHVLAGLARGSMRGHKSVLQGALTGHFRDHHGYLLAMMCDRVDALTAQIEALTGRIDEVIAPDESQRVGRPAESGLVATGG